MEELATNLRADTRSGQGDNCGCWKGGRLCSTRHRCYSCCRHRRFVVASSFSHPHPLPCLAEANFPSFLVIVVLTGCTSTRALRLCVVEDVRGGGRQFECGQGGRVQCVV
ncbi:hypothetical protein BD309DRAFT_146827 [Dichomitus squalens]|nr:hypothetical protein BD309DRAFT_146827 [Dichomitus squalens]